MIGGKNTLYKQILKAVKYKKNNIKTITVNVSRQNVKGVLAIRRIFSLVDMITKPKF